MPKHTTTLTLVVNGEARTTIPSTRQIALTGIRYVREYIRAGVCPVAIRRTATGVEIVDGHSKLVYTTRSL